MDTPEFLIPVGDPAPPPSAIDPRDLRVHRAPPERDVPYVPTDEPVVAAMLRFASVTEHDVVYDLGCGDGRIPIHAAKHYGCRGVGVDIDPQRIFEAREGARRARVEHLVRFRCESFFDTPIADATVVMLYLLPAVNVKLRPRLLSELKVGTRVIANYFEMGDWRPDMQANVHHRVLHQWVVPAWVAGRWNCVVNEPGRRRRMILRMQRRYQVVTGVAILDGKEIPIGNGRLFGDRMTFKLYDPRRKPSSLRFHAKVEGLSLRGNMHAGIEEVGVEWGGAWAARV
jgi:SAM-dependent methyltransferase